MRIRLTVLGALVAACIVGPGPTTSEEGLPAVEGVKQMLEAAGGSDAERLAEVFPADLVAARGMDAGQIAAWRKAFARELAGAKTIDVLPGEDEAMVTFSGRSRRTVMAIRIRREAAGWVLACAQSYEIAGVALRKTRGRGPAHVTLTPRPDNRSYGESAWSFPYATGRSDDCKNRMSVWFCRYGDLHTVGRSRIAEWGRQPLDDVSGFKAGLAWDRWVEPESGRSYVVHCVLQRRDAPVDFFVKLHVTKVSARAVEFDWELLSTGPGSPATIHRAQPVPDPLSGSDGCDGYCGGKMR